MQIHLTLSPNGCCLQAKYSSSSLSHISCIFKTSYKIFCRPSKDEKRPKLQGTWNFAYGVGIRAPHRSAWWLTVCSPTQRLTATIQSQGWIFVICARGVGRTESKNHFRAFHSLPYYKRPQEVQPQTSSARLCPAGLEGAGAAGTWGLLSGNSLVCSGKASKPANPHTLTGNTELRNQSYRPLGRWQAQPTDTCSWATDGRPEPLPSCPKPLSALNCLGSFTSSLSFVPLLIKSLRGQLFPPSRSSGTSPPFLPRLSACLRRAPRTHRPSRPPGAQDNGLPASAVRRWRPRGLGATEGVTAEPESGLAALFGDDADKGG